MRISNFAPSPLSVDIILDGVKNNVRSIPLICVIVLSIPLALIAVGEEALDDNCGSSFSTCIMEVAGMPSGGTFGFVNFYEKSTLLVNTSPGNSCTQVLHAVDQKLRSMEDTSPYRISFIIPEKETRIMNNSLLLPYSRGSYFRIGTENGFIAPHEPKFLTCMFTNEMGTYSIFVEKGTRELIDSETYADNFYTLFYSIDDDMRYPYGICNQYHGYSINEKWAKQFHGPTKVVFYPWENYFPGFPVTLTIGRTFQESFIEYPIGYNVFPCWLEWQTQADVPQSPLFSLEENAIPFGESAQMNTISPRNYFQKILASGDIEGCGIWRKYLGLKPGHQYGFSATINTLDVAESNSSPPSAESPEWSFTAHAVPSNIFSSETPAAEDFVDANASQTQILRYDPRNTTSGQWITRTTGDKGPGSCIDCISLPEQCDSLTVWLKCSGHMPNGVGISGFRLEVLGTN